MLQSLEQPLEKKSENCNQKAIKQIAIDQSEGK